MKASSSSRSAAARSEGARSMAAPYDARSEGAAITSRRCSEQPPPRQMDVSLAHGGAPSPRRARGRSGTPGSLLRLPVAVLAFQGVAREIERRPRLPDDLTHDLADPLRAVEHREVVDVAERLRG